MFLLNSRIPLVRFSSELVVLCDEWVDENTSTFGLQKEKAKFDLSFNYISIFMKKPQPPNPQSQSFSRSYGSNLPNSLIYIILLTRGC